jgi:ubiquinone/menaquinone biosynthesis C-methylase UbiE
MKSGSATSFNEVEPHHKRSQTESGNQRLISISLIILILWGLFTSAVLADTNSVYQYRTNHNRDGIGKFYMGREIAHVMGHMGAGWLERRSREAEEKPSKVVSALHLKPTDVVADIGAGTGYMSFRMASLVPEGKVLAVDVQPEMLDILGFLQQERHITNVEPVLATPTNTNLPQESIDLALMVDAYHEFEYPQEVMQGIIGALKPGGRVVLVEYRGENPFILIKALHKMTQKQVKKEMQAVGLVWRETQEFLPQQHFLVFEKSAEL